MSFTVIKHIICELTGYRPGTVDVSQGDRGSRAVSCRLMENGAPWMIPEGATARVAYTLPDGTEGLYDRRPDGSPMWEITKNIVTVELADQLMAQAGMVQMSILILGPEGGQLATWPIRVMVSANKAARLTVPEAMPPYGAGFEGKIFFGGADGTVTPLGIGAGVEIVRQEDGTFVLVAYGGSGGGGGITEEKDPTVPAWAKQPQKPTYTAEEVGALPKDTKIPGKTSELTNDAGFVDKAVNDLVNYYDKVQLQELIASIPRFRVTVVQQLPAAGEALVLYLVPFATAEGQCLEYIWVDGRWEIIGSQRVDLTGYATEVWVKDYVAEHSGQNPPQDGFSPIATVEQNADGATIIITDANGTTIATVKNGKDGEDGYTPQKGVDYFDGQPGNDGYTPVKGKDYSDGADGVSPTVAVSAITGGHRISITDKNGTKTVDVMDGEDGDPGDPGRGIKSIARTSGNGAAGTTDTYTITYTDNTTSTFTVRNGSNGVAGQAATIEITGATALAYGAAPTITEQSGSTAQARKYKIGIPAGKPGADAESPILTMYISPDGSDSNDGLTADTPKKTVKACVNAGASRISAKRGVYREAVQLWNIGELEISPTDNELEYAVGVEREPIVFEVADSVAVSSLAAYNSIKRVAYSNADNTQFDKVFTKKSQPPVVSDYGSRYNATVWLLSNDEKTVCIKLKPVLTVAECEAEGNTFTYVSGYIYINADLTGVEKIIVPALWETGFYINGAQKLVLKEVEVRFSGTYNIDIRNCAYFDFYKCACKYTSYGSGFHPFNSNGKLTACYATKNYDGYGISGYGHTTYVDCVSEFNFDDGMSHHDGTSGTVIGGRYEGNGKGGNTPAYGAKVNIYGGLYKDNASFGIGYLWATDLEPASGMVQGAVMVGNPIGLVINKNCDVTAMNCTYKDNTTDTENKGNLIEYNPAYVKSVNGTKPDENGNVEIEISGGNTEPAYTNVLPLAVASGGGEYVGANGEDGYNPGYRISSSDTEKPSEVNACTGFIECKAGDVIRLKNIGVETSGYSVAYFYKSDFARTTGAIQMSGTAFAPDNNGVYSFTVPAYADIVYTRITVGSITADTIITVNEEIPA